MGKKGASDNLLSFLQRITDADERRGEEAVIVSSIYKEAASAGFHKMALRLVHRLRKMDSAKATEFLRCFDLYRHEVGLDQQPDLFDEKTKEPAQGA